jgi:hypothetical protein
MTHAFQEIVIGGVLVSPLITYVAIALAAVLALRPILRVLRFDELFSHPSVAALSLYVAIFGLLITL